MSKKQSKTNSTIPAVLYIRMSSSAQEASPEQQREECRKLAEKNGYKIIREYFDSAISGADTKRRKQFLKMIKDAESQRGFSVILCWDQDRFGRFDMSEANYYWYRLREAGVMVQTVAQGEIKTTELADWLKASIAQHGKHQFLIDLSRNTLRGRQKAALAGKTISRPAYGYDRVFFDAAGTERHRARYGEKFAKPSAWTVQFAPSEDTESVDVVKRIFHRYGTSDIGYGSLALELNKAGVPSPAGSSWCDKTVRNILTNPVYVGDLVWGRTRQGKFHVVDENGDISEAPSQSVRKMPGAAPIVIHDSHIGLVSREEFDRVQRKLSRNKGTRQKRRDGGYLLTGIIRCGHCGIGMYMVRHARKQTYYVCCNRNAGNCKSRNIDSVAIEQYAIAYVVETIQSADLYDRIRSAVETQATGLAHMDDDRPRTLQKRLRLLERNIQQGTENMLRAETDSTFKLLHQGLEKWQQEANTIRQELRAATEKPRIEATELIESAMAQLDQLATNVRHADVSVARDALKSFYKSIVVWWTERPQTRKSIKTQARTRKYRFSRGLLTLQPDCQGLLVNGNFR